MPQQVLLRLRRKCVRRALILLIIITSLTGLLLYSSPVRIPLSPYGVSIVQNYDRAYLWINVSGYITPPQYLVKPGEAFTVSLVLRNITNIPLANITVENDIGINYFDYAGGIYLSRSDIENFIAPADILLDPGLKAYSPYPPYSTYLEDPGRWILVYYSPYLLNVTVELEVYMVDPVIAVDNAGWGTYNGVVEIRGVNRVVDVLNIAVEPGKTETIPLNKTCRITVIKQEVRIGPLTFSIEDSRLILDLSHYSLVLLTIEIAVGVPVILTKCRKTPGKRRVRK